MIMMVDDHHVIDMCLTLEPNMMSVGCKYTTDVNECPYRAGMACTNPIKLTQDLHVALRRLSDEMVKLMGAN